MAACRVAPPTRVLITRTSGQLGRMICARLTGGQAASIIAAVRNPERELAALKVHR